MKRCATESYDATYHLYDFDDKFIGDIIVRTVKTPSTSVTVEVPEGVEFDIDVFNKLQEHTYIVAGTLASNKRILCERL